MTLRIASYNIRTARAPDRRSFWWGRRGALARAIAAVDADVWGLQEVFALQRRYLEADVLGGHAWVGSGRTRSRAGEGLFVAARRERVAVEGGDVRWFGAAPDRPGSKLPGAGFPRIAVLASLLVDDRALLLVDVHLDERSSERRAASVRQLATWVGEEAAGRSVAVLGDFNEEPLVDLRPAARARAGPGARPRPRRLQPQLPPRGAPPDRQRVALAGRSGRRRPGVGRGGDGLRPRPRGRRPDAGLSGSRPGQVVPRRSRAPS
ncbi:MAG: endonuclease/exonuclease/phosphatase family protein [Acidimicrobiales bacterium]